MVETPVLFETFVRVDYARQVWDAIKAAQPKKLYFYSNKGRVEKKGEIENNDEIRSWIKEIDWDCELHTWFRDECVDVFTSLIGAIDWLFDNEEEGIILEDDCVPTKAFFSFCDQMITKFRDEEKVWYVSGDNFYDLNPSGFDYIFSRYHWMYGWASWRNRWNKFQRNGKDGEHLLLENKCYGLYKTKRQAISRERQIDNTLEFVRKTLCWDYALGYSVDYHQGFGVFPKMQLIHNIGLAGANHNGNPQISFVNAKPKIQSDVYIIKSEPKTVECDKEFDYCYCLIRRNEKTLKSKVYGLYCDILWVCKKFIKFLLTK